MDFEMFVEVKCPVCGKVMYVQPDVEYGWKFREDYFCSYTCMRKVEKKFLGYVNSGIVKQEPTKRKIPIEYLDVYRNLMNLRTAISKRDKIKRMNIYQRFDDSNLQKAELLLQQYDAKIDRIKMRYACGVKNMPRADFDLLHDYIIKHYDYQRLYDKYKLSYDDLCDRFIKIMDYLNTFKSSKDCVARWMCKR